MTDPLPDREWIKRFCEGDFDGPVEHAEPWVVLEAYASGRLVDRETIDLAALGEHLAYLRGVQLTVGEAAELVGAALGDGYG